MRFLLAVGALRPLVLAAALLSALAAGVDVTDGMAYGAAHATVLGIPAVGAALYRRLPPGWSRGWQVAVVVLLTPPVFAAELFLTLGMLVAGMTALGHCPA